MTLPTPTPQSMLATMDRILRRCKWREGTNAPIAVLVVEEADIADLEAVRDALAKRVGRAAA